MIGGSSPDENKELSEMRYVNLSFTRSAFM
jgi:hypothetical protein